MSSQSFISVNISEITYKFEDIVDSVSDSIIMNKRFGVGKLDTDRNKNIILSGFAIRGFSYFSGFEMAELQEKVFRL